MSRRGRADRQGQRGRRTWQERLLLCFSGGLACALLLTAGGLAYVYSKYSQKKRKGRLPYGTVRVVVHTTALVQSIYGAIQEYGGFERPEWLG